MGSCQTWGENICLHFLIKYLQDPLPSREYNPQCTHRETESQSHVARRAADLGAQLLTKTWVFIFSNLHMIFVPYIFLPYSGAPWEPAFRALGPSY